MSSARSAITKLRLARSLGETQIGASRSVESIRGPAIRYFSDDKGRVLSEEERAKESMYIQVLLHLRHCCCLLDSNVWLSKFGFKLAINQSISRSFGKWL